jgi:hypothetical protein
MQLPRGNPHPVALVLVSDLALVDRYSKNSFARSEREKPVNSLLKYDWRHVGFVSIRSAISQSERRKQFC